MATGLIVDPTFVGFGVSNVTLSGAANTYTGRTTVNTGTLTLTGSLSSSSALTVANSGTFAYAPTVAATTQTINGVTTGAGFNSVTTANAANVLNIGSATRGASNGLLSFTPRPGPSTRPRPVTRMASSAHGRLPARPPVCNTRP